MTGRALRIELRRGVAPLAAAVVAVAVLATMFNETEHWVGRWAGLAGYVRVVLIVVVPVAVAAGAWQGGRERRRRIDELLASTPRPQWQRRTTVWAAACVGVIAGLLAALLVCAVLVVRVATYSGGGWWWMMLVGLVAMGAGSAVGYAVGRLVPWRITAALAGIACYVITGLLSYAEDSGRGWLLPAINDAMDGEYLEVSFHALQAVWFAALGVTALVVIAARRRWLALVPVAVAAVAGGVILTGPGDARWQEDAAALELVCVEGTPEVCTTREKEFLLDDFATASRQVLGRFEGIDGVPSRVQEPVSWTESPDEDVANIGLTSYISWRGTLASTEQYGGSLSDELIRNYLPSWYECYDDLGNEVLLDDEVMVALSDVEIVAIRWAGGDPDAAGVETTRADGAVEYRSGGEVWRAEPIESPGYDELITWPEDRQRDWIQRYVNAGKECAPEAVTGLLDELV